MFRNVILNCLLKIPPKSHTKNIRQTDIITLYVHFKLKKNCCILKSLSRMGVREQNQRGCQQQFWNGDILPWSLSRVVFYSALCHCCAYLLRWYGTPCNIYKNERLKYDYNYGFKSFRNFNIFPKNFTEEIKKNKADARFEPATLLLIIHPSTDWTTRKVIKFSMNKYQ